MKHTLDYDLLTKAALKLAALNTKLIEHCREPDRVIVMASEIHDTVLELTTLLPEGEPLAAAIVESVLSSLQAQRDEELITSFEPQGDA